MLNPLVYTCLLGLKCAGWQKTRNTQTHTHTPTTAAHALQGLIIESVDSISRDDPGTPYITNTLARYTFKHSKHHHRYLQVISYPVNVITTLYNCNYMLNHVMTKIVICPSFFGRANKALSYPLAPVYVKISAQFSSAQCSDLAAFL